MEQQEQNAIVVDISRPDKDGLCKLSVKYLKRDGTPLEFPSSYTSVPDALLKDFNLGEQVTVTTKKGRAKTVSGLGSDGKQPPGTVSEANKGDERRAFYWDFQAISKGPAPAAAPTTSAPPSTSNPATPGRPYDARNTSIERQVAVKAAVELAVAGKIGTENIAEWIEFFAASIAGAPSELQAAPAPGVTFEDLGQAGEPSSQEWSNFWASQTKAGRDSKAVSAKLGAMPDAWLRAQPGRTLLEAAKVLEAKP